MLFLEPSYSCPAPLRDPRKYLLCISILFHTGGRSCPDDSAGCGLAELLKIILKMPTIGGSGAGLHFTPSTPGLATPQPLFAIQACGETGDMFWFEDAK